MPETQIETKRVNLIFPHQLFKQHPLLDKGTPIYLVEEYLFFKQYAFHKMKIAFHRASMKSFEAHLIEEGHDVFYIDSQSELADIRTLIPHFKDLGVGELYYVDPVDDWLQKRILEGSRTVGIETVSYDSPMFLNTKKELSVFFKPEKKKYHQTSFYTQERKKRKILVDEDQNPVGGKWTFDNENRKKYPRNKLPPPVQFPDLDQHYEEALAYVGKYFSSNPGELAQKPLYPINYGSTELWFERFLSTRFFGFGDYEDAIVADASILNHSVLTPMLNVGLISPNDIVQSSLTYARENDVPINSTEGFIRQIIGWREFMRGVYVSKGREERLKNFWGFDRKIPISFYDGTTGIEPIDQTIKKVLKTGYCHHIERLMVLGNFMLLCEFDPDAVYQWFMELFIDAYDWVMVPNVYGMSQFADGGLMSTKPYISGSNYLMKMGDYEKGDWQVTWDGLFWRFMHLHRDFFTQNPRMGMLVKMFDKMPEEKRKGHLTAANDFLDNLK